MSLGILIAIGMVNDAKKKGFDISTAELYPYRQQVLTLLGTSAMFNEGLAGKNEHFIR